MANMMPMGSPQAGHEKNSLPLAFALQLLVFSDIPPMNFEVPSWQIASDKPIFHKSPSKLVTGNFIIKFCVTWRSTFFCGLCLLLSCSIGWPNDVVLREGGKLLSGHFLRNNIGNGHMLSHTIGPSSSVLSALTGSVSPEFQAEFSLPVLTGDAKGWTWQFLHVNQMPCHWDIAHL